LRAACPGREIGVGFGVRHRRYGAADADLAVERLPVKGEGCLGVGSQFLTLPAFVVRIEDEAVLVEPLEQDHPDVRQPVAVDGSQGHGVRIVRLAAARVLEPCGKKAKRFRTFGEITRR
jgi:hypothetical protein